MKIIWMQCKCPNEKLTKNTREDIIELWVKPPSDEGGGFCEAKDGGRENERV